MLRYALALQQRQSDNPIAFAPNGATIKVSDLKLPASSFDILRSVPHLTCQWVQLAEAGFVQSGGSCHQASACGGTSSRCWSCSERSRSCSGLFRMLHAGVLPLMDALPVPSGFKPSTAQATNAVRGWMKLQPPGQCPRAPASHSSWLPCLESVGLLLDAC